MSEIKLTLTMIAIVSVLCSVSGAYFLGYKAGERNNIRSTNEKFIKEGSVLLQQAFGDTNSLCDCNSYDFNLINKLFDNPEYSKTGSTATER